MKSLQLHQWLARNRVDVVDVSTKEDAIELGLALLCNHPNIADPDALRRAIWEREGVLPTGIGLGIGVPHVRIKAVRDHVASLLVLREGVDYGSIDKIPVRVILLIAMPDGTHMEYLEYLATATRLFQQEAIRNALMACQTADELWDTLCRY